MTEQSKQAKQSVRPFRRRTGSFVALALAALVTVSCGRSDQGGTSGGAAPAAAGKSATELLPSDVKKKGVLRVATAVGYPPMEMYKPGTTELTGVDPDLARAVADRLGLRLELTNAAFDGLIPGLKSGRFDLVMSSMTDSPERRKAVDFVDYFRTGGVIMTKKGNPEGIKTLEDLCGKAVVLAKGSSNLAIGQEQNTRCGKKMRISQSEDAPTGLLQIDSGRAVATIVDYPVAAMFVKEKGTYEALPEQYGTAPWGIAVGKDRSGLRDAVQRALQDLIDDGGYRKVLDSYGVGGSAVPKATVNDGT
ncbi:MULTISPECIES: ABC transporter substrate-binding protein [Streptomyces]|uniref:ABC transporter substrate-binding protein n=1 Tax=Streptomyces tsukubensis (strain DSM 42081 / NBRC 108919 / NRRL 18488 / 9993) TaxID=1114943 RepID=I2MTQ1_STRT9|nr:MULTISPECIES: ABC transporter substrate-binding protein [Streptomyces]AZK92702.1 ABC transporter substrate-binding protein [Streptomyces tsukubensis]EIF88148.1 extracellular solute-binding protein [Streptomyces tsukubensis NRRL18488]MYS67028.1 transporter substrate-binding domain-containing protein [Streptomyces sp. SID5473]QKM71131.1 ABC transporter substrate-binding protein [Streptomyces tsukubensis NRRL18488]TAI41617.1 ABC transporter substrate-binding protein [Streptomyces tsukubensis]